MQMVTVLGQVMASLRLFYAVAKGRVETAEALAKGAAVKHQRGKHLHCTRTRGQRTQGAQTVSVGYLRVEFHMYTRKF